MVIFFYSFTGNKVDKPWWYTVNTTYRELQRKLRLWCSTEEPRRRWISQMRRSKKSWAHSRTDSDFLDDSNNHDNLTVNDNVKDGHRAPRRGYDSLRIRQCRNSSDKISCIANCFVTKAVTSVKISCSDSGRDFIRANFAVNFFFGDIDGMDFLLCRSIFMVSLGGRSINEGVYLEGALKQFDNI